MRCPFCQHTDDKVVDSREGGDGDVIRRRRECLACKRRFTTYERVDVVMPMVVKKDGRREPWDRAKLEAGFHKACEKRPVPTDAIDEGVSRIERSVQERGLREIGSDEVGEQVMATLKKLDEVAYVRFASVYRSFRDIAEFQRTVEGLVQERESAMKEPRESAMKEPRESAMKEPRESASKEPRDGATDARPASGEDPKRR